MLRRPSRCARWPPLKDLMHYAEAPCKAAGTGIAEAAGTVKALGLPTSLSDIGSPCCDM